MLFRKVTPNPNSEWSALQQETLADQDIAREARYICKIFGNSYAHNSPSDRALRDAWERREADYLFARFGGALGWTSTADAERFYRRNR